MDPKSNPIQKENYLSFGMYEYTHKKVIEFQTSNVIIYQYQIS